MFRTIELSNPAFERDGLRVATIDRSEIAPMVIALPSYGLERDGSGYLSWPGSL